MPTQKKIDEVKLLKEKLEKAKAFFLTDYRGLTHPQLENLRKLLKKAEGEYVVVKNTLLKLSLKDQRVMDSDTRSKLENELKNPTATLFVYGDEIAPIKVLADFIKSHQLPKIKLGLFSGKITTESEFNKLAILPTKEVLLAILAMRLKAPIYGLHYALRWNMQGLVVALDNVKNKK